jgi:hypothetical protein
VFLTFTCIFVLDVARGFGNGVCSVTKSL